jgi:hypothetical protein
VPITGKVIEEAWRFFMKADRPSKCLSFLIAVLILLVAPTGRADACRCGNDPPQEKLDLSDVVFTGTVSDTMVIEGRYLLGIFTWIDCWKGTLPEQISVVTALTSAGCGIAFQPGSDYLIYGFGTPDSVSTTSCWSLPLESAQGDIDALGPPKTTPVLPASWGQIKQEYR